jgi:transposase, IS5 family
LSEDSVPDECSILRVRHLLEKHTLTKVVFAEIGSLHAKKRLLLKQGIIVDATIISSPSRTKNRSGTRDPEMRQKEKGNTWFFGMKAHEGTDKRGCVHSVMTTDAAQSDIAQKRELFRASSTASRAETEQIFSPLRIPSTW